MNTHHKARSRFRSRAVKAMAGAIALAFLATGAMSASASANYPRISGSGSSWAGNALAQWLADVKTQGVTVDYSPTGSSIGRREFANSIKQFGVSEIPYRGDTADPLDDSYPDTGFTMMPMVAGGTSFMYNLPIGGTRYENLNLSQSAIAGIFAGQITRWDAPEIAADNPDITLPPAPITVVVRSEGSGATAQFTLWMLRQFPDAYRALCATTGCNPDAATSYYPTQGLANFRAQSGSSGVTTYTTSNEYTINYDEYSYALQVGYPVANVRNAAGFYVLPTDNAVAVALTQAAINSDPASENYLSQDLSAVYPYGDPRSYPMSAYSYFIVPTEARQGFDAGSGSTLGYFTQYSLCEGQRTMGALGYSPLPMNLVLAAMDEVRKIPGVDAATLARLDAAKAGATGETGDNPCNNPTFQPGDSPSRNILVDQAPFPAGCDEACQAPWRLAGTGVGSGPEYGEASGAAAPVAAGPAGPVKPTEVCDPDTGICSSGVDASGLGNARAIPTVLTGSEGWAGPQTLIVIACLLLGALLLAPPIAARAAGRRQKAASGDRR